MKITKLVNWGALALMLAAVVALAFTHRLPGAPDQARDPSSVTDPAHQ